MKIAALLVLSTVNFIDAISYMCVAPSLIFYVQSVGGNKEQYGLIMSAFSLASFSGKPFYGLWVDKSGNKFRAPYVTSFILAIVGGLSYAFASSFESSSTALGLILAGRVLGGLAAGNNALGFAYLALTVPFERQTTTNSLLSMTRIFGMALGPVANILLAGFNTTVTIFGSSIHITPLNSVGLMLTVLNLLMLPVLLVFLPEPESKEKLAVPIVESGKRGRRMSVEEKRGVWNAFFCIELVIPLLVIFIVNSNFLLVETALAPAAADGLGWGPIETSSVLGSSSIVVGAAMVFVMVITKYISDVFLQGIGAMLWFVGGVGIYMGWTRGAPVWHYVIPVMVCVSGFPFIAASNRSSFSKSVASKPELEGMQASMQALLSMAASVAGFVTPGFVATFVIRTPEQVDAAGNDRELTPIALYTPILSFFILIGMYLLWRKEHMTEGVSHTVDDEETAATDQTSLIGRSGQRTSVVMIEETLSKEMEVYRRASVEIMGLSLVETYEETTRRQSVAAEWKEIRGMFSETEAELS